MQSTHSSFPDSSSELLPREQVEQMMPDYLFCQLSAEQSAHFERSVVQFPDIEHELQQARTVFAQMKPHDIYERQTRRARHLSVQLQTRKAEAREHKKQVLRSLRFAAPVLALGLFVVVVFLPQFRQYQDTNTPVFLQEQIVFAPLAEPQWSDELHKTLSENTEDIASDQIAQVVTAPDIKETDFVTDGVLLLDAQSAQVLADGLANNSSLFGETLSATESVSALQEDDVQHLFSTLDRTKKKQ